MPGTFLYDIKPYVDFFLENVKKELEFVQKGGAASGSIRRLRLCAMTLESISEKSISRAYLLDPLKTHGYYNFNNLVRLPEETEFAIGKMINEAKISASSMIEIDDNALNTLARFKKEYEAWETQKRNPTQPDRAKPAPLDKDKPVSLDGKQPASSLGGEKPVSLDGKQPTSLGGEKPVSLDGKQPTSLGGEKPVSLDRKQPAPLSGKKVVSSRKKTIPQDLDGRVIALIKKYPEKGIPYGGAKVIISIEIELEQKLKALEELVPNNTLSWKELKKIYEKQVAPLEQSIKQNEEKIKLFVAEHSVAGLLNQRRNSSKGLDEQVFAFMKQNPNKEFSYNQAKGIIETQLQLQEQVSRLSSIALNNKLSWKAIKDIYQKGIVLETGIAEKQAIIGSFYQGLK